MLSLETCHGAFYLLFNSTLPGAGDAGWTNADSQPRFASALTSWLVLLLLFFFFSSRHALCVHSKDRKQVYPSDAPCCNLHRIANPGLEVSRRLGFQNTQGLPVKAEATTAALCHRVHNCQTWILPRGSCLCANTPWVGKDRWPGKQRTGGAWVQESESRHQCLGGAVRKRSAKDRETQKEQKPGI